jgi:hypothetical protein
MRFAQQVALFEIERSAMRQRAGKTPNLQPTIEGTGYLRRLKTQQPAYKRDGGWVVHRLNHMPNRKRTVTFDGGFGTAVCELFLEPSSSISSVCGGQRSIRYGDIVSDASCTRGAKAHGGQCHACGASNEYYFS